MRVIHCFPCPPPSLVHDLHLFLAEVISNLSPVSFSPTSLHSSVGKKGGLGGWYRHKHIPYFFPCEGSFQATWSSATFFLGHAHQRQANEWGETEREGESFLLVFPGVYLTWLHLRFFYKSAIFIRALDVLHPPRASMENCPDMTCCSAHRKCLHTRLSGYLTETCHRCLFFLD